jgi:hypothetical protein
MVDSMPARLFAVRTRDALVFALVGILALAPLAPATSAKSTIVRSNLPFAPASETEPDSEESQSALAVRTHARWTPAGGSTRHRKHPHAFSNQSFPPRISRDMRVLTPNEGHRLRC